jgi:hypothetical protein
MWGFFSSYFIAALVGARNQSEANPNIDQAVK